MHGAAIDLSEVIVFLAAAGIIVPLAHRFRISPVLGFLLIGLLIGPHGAGRISAEIPVIGIAVIEDGEGLRFLAEFGIVLLLFMIGLELSVDRLLAMRRLVFGYGGLQVLASAVVIGAIAFGFGNSGAASIVLGGCFALSSTAIVMQLLTEAHRLGSPSGRAAFAVLLLQDLAVVPILFLVGLMGAGGDGPVVLAFAKAIGLAALTIGAIAIVGRLVIRPLFRLVGATHSRELFMATVLLTVIATAVATATAGLSMALGAFLAGLLLAETEYRHQVEVDIEPFKGLLLGLFFLSIGMGIDPLAIVAAPGWILASVVGLFAIKAGVLYPLGRVFGLSRAVSLETALLLGQGGEFAFVVIGLATTLGLVPAATAQFMVIVTGLSMMATPLVARLGRRLAARLEVADDTPPELAAIEGEGHVVIAGYGRVGQLLGSMLDQQAIAHVAIESDARLVAALRDAGAAIHVGDASRPAMLKRVGIDRAAALVVTMDSTAAAERIVAAVRQSSPSLPILARARDTAHGRRLMAAGASRVVPETVEASLQLGEALLAGVGLPEDAARAIVEARRRAEEGLLVG